MRAAALALTLGLMANLVVNPADAKRGEGDPSPARPDLGPGVSRELALWRSRYYRDIRYSLDITITTGADKLQGRAAIEVTLGDIPADLVLDWRPPNLGRAWDIEVNDAAADARFESEHLVIPRGQLRAGKNVVRLRFEAPISVSGSAVTRYLDREDGSEYVYTLLVPSDASTVFPCFDQPDLKARFTLELTLPAGWTAVGNSAATEYETASGRRYRFAETLPISTYLFAFAAGPFVEVGRSDAPPSPRPPPPGRRGPSRAPQWRHTL